MYRVVSFFTDLQDNSYAYNVGDVFPRVGMTVSSDRINELRSAENKQHKQLIEYVDEEEGISIADEPQGDIDSDFSYDSPIEAQETFDEISLSDMTTKEIVALAERRGYKITKIKKSDVISQFLAQQG